LHESWNKETFSQDKKIKSSKSRKSSSISYSSDDSHSRNKDPSKMTDRDWRIFREDNDIIIKGGRVPPPLRNWSDGGVLPDYILKSISDAGFKRPSPIQMQGIPIGLEKRDMIGLAPTGSGKSLAFLLPLIFYLFPLPRITTVNANHGPYAIILAPSRELAIQIHETFKTFAKPVNLKGVLLIGGRSQDEQMIYLGMGAEVIIATPGRLQDALQQGYTTLENCNYVVIDEADKMIKENFEETLNFILDCIPSSNLKSADEKIAELEEKECKSGQKDYRITMMFSATMNPTLESLARKYLRCPAYISIGDPGQGKKNIKQSVYYLTEEYKRSKLRDLISDYSKFRPPIIIFVNKKREADSLCKFMEKNSYKGIAMHGGKTQDSREKALNGFKAGKYDILICTNVLARGIDVEGVELVVNFDCPDDIEDYTHRIGRTGRAGLKGEAITFITKENENIFQDLREFLEHSDQPVPEELKNYFGTRKENKHFKSD
jgi:ATP-dependent RNA helicase DDX23/PRP28